jgi:predicted  nucleic acid-binding Zn-ribbon protein
VLYNRKEFKAMQEVLTKLNEGLSLLKAKLETAAKKEKELQNAQNKLDAIQEKQRAAENNLHAKERLFSKYEDLENAEKSIKERKAESSLLLTSAQQKNTEAENLLKSVKLQQVGIDEIKALLDVRAKKLDELTAQVKKEKEEFKAKLASMGIK